MMRALAIIPARSGSKGLPDKNIIDLNGKPLMFYTIHAAIESNCFEEIMVSTDCKRYAEIAKKYGAKVPFFRSKTTSGDTSSSWDVVREVLKNYEQIGRTFDYIALLQPTSPLRMAEDIIRVFEMLKSEEIRSIVSVTEVDHPVQWCFTMPENHSMKTMANSPYNYTRRQELEKYYHENGAIYVVDAKKIEIPQYNFYDDQCYGYVMPRERSVDIDKEIDLLITAAYIENYSNFLNEFDV